MTKREICERLMDINNRLFEEGATAEGVGDIDIGGICKDIGSLILDLAVPKKTDDKQKADDNPWR